jgi:predicted nucleic acid-binding protein
MIVADTGAVYALLDRTDPCHDVLRALFEERPSAWVLPSIILPELDALAATDLGPRAHAAFMRDLAEGLYRLHFIDFDDLIAAHTLHAKYSALHMGLVDACVMAVAERLRAEAIATLDLRHFGAVRLRSAPKLLPRDL